MQPVLGRVEFFVDVVADRDEQVAVSHHLFDANRFHPTEP